MNAELLKSGKLYYSLYAHIFLFEDPRTLFYEGINCVYCHKDFDENYWNNRAIQYTNYALMKGKKVVPIFLGLPFLVLSSYRYRDKYFAEMYYEVLFGTNRGFIGNSYVMKIQEFSEENT